jgi:NADPH:quinone reductase
VKAVVITRPGDADVLALQDRPVPQPGPGEVRVRVHASALNRADLLQRRGRYPAPPGSPADIPGLEYAGEVDAMGEGAGLWAVGNRVMGIVGGGGHAQHVVVHEREAIRVPHDMPFEQAAAIPEAFLTAYDALFRQLDLKMGERLLITAVGSGVGTAALQLARAASAEVIGTSRTAEKLARASEELGLETGIDTSKEDLSEAVNQATYGGGVHAVLDLVGGELLEASLRVVAQRGRVAIVGTTAGSKVQVDLGLLLRRRIHLFGTVLRSRPLEEKMALAREFSSAVLPLFSSGRIRAIVDAVIPFKDVRKAHQRLEANRSFGKIVLTW